MSSLAITITVIIVYILVAVATFRRLRFFTKEPAAAFIFALVWPIASVLIATWFMVTLVLDIWNGRL